jgi:hypothetical protein
VMIGLPYGSRTTKNSLGEKVALPDTLRLHRHALIFDMYSNYLDEIDQKRLRIGRSTAFELLKVCSATRRKSLFCVDSYIADGMDVKI